MRGRYLSESLEFVNNLVVQLNVFFIRKLSSSVHFIYYLSNQIFFNGEFDPGSG